MNPYEIYRRYKDTYTNYASVLWEGLRKRNDIRVVLKDKSVHTWKANVVFHFSQIYTDKMSHLIRFSADEEEDFIEFEYRGKRIKMCEGTSNGDVGDVFWTEDYKFLNVEDENVIDIGANIGDSSIYFALNNAKKVVALEPYPYSYNIALKNMQENKMEDRVELLNAGYGEDRTVRIDENFENTFGSDLKKFSVGKEIEIYSLKTLFNKYSLDSVVLKMDCEGCEYSLLREDDDILRKFKRIQIEYHYGYEKLKEKLESSGFNVKFTRPHKVYNRDSDDPDMAVGYIYAE